MVLVIITVWKQNAFRLLVTKGLKIVTAYINAKMVKLELMQTVSKQRDKYVMGQK
jgi:hypothetical protein